MCNILEIQKLSKEFDSFSLKNIDITLKKGEVVGLIGNNGAGKTTIIKLLLGSYIKDSGNILFKGKSIVDNPIYFKENIGVVLDDLYAPQSMTISQIKKFLKKVYKNFDENLFNSYMEKYKLPDNKKIESFSKGMKAKLSILLATCHNPDLIIMDEPTLGLDLSSREQLIKDIRNLVENDSKTILLCSHLLDDIEQLCDKLIFIKNGQITSKIEKDTLNSMNKEELKQFILKNIEVEV